MNNNTLLKMNNISKKFPGVQALDDVSLEVKKGEVHAIIGENGAGKSTLMKILNGMYLPDKGEIILNGKKVDIRETHTSLSLGISMIHQELNPVPQMTIAENIFLGREPESRFKGFINFNKLYKDTQKILNEQELKYNPKTKMIELSVSDMQMIEIIKAITYNSLLIIMDEPTSALSEDEIDKLFKKVKTLKAKGISIIFITHKLDEIFKIVDQVTVLRDGKFVDSKPIKDLNKEKIISMMVGRKINNLFPKVKVELGKKIFEVKNITRKGIFNNVSFGLKKGEILGIAGLMGAGRTEVAEAIFGLDKLDAGEIILDGKKIKIRSTSDAINNGIVLLSEDRKRFGLILCRSILENIALPNLKHFSKNVFLNKGKEKLHVKDISKLINIKAPSIYTMANSLSGGNQQKVVVAKWLLSRPKILILDEPTRGIDVGAKYEIHKIMGNLVKQGMSIIMISSELPEILGMSDRIIIMHEGKITGELLSNEATQEKILALAT